MIDHREYLRTALHTHTGRAMVRRCGIQPCTMDLDDHAAWPDGRCREIAERVLEQLQRAYPILF